MENLPLEIIPIIFNYIPIIDDKRNFLRTCKKYNIITKQLLNNIKYAIFNVYYDCDMDQHYALICICDTLNDCKQCITNFQKKRYSGTDCYAVLSRRDDAYNTFDNYPKKGFLIEEIIINEIL